jgi:hypothetical protein
MGLFGADVLACSIDNLSVWVGKTAAEAANKTYESLYTCSGLTVYLYAECHIGTDPESPPIKWLFDYDGNDVTDETKYTYSSSSGPSGSGTFSKTGSWDYSLPYLYLGNVQVERGDDAYGGDHDADTFAVDVGPEMKLEKVGDTTIDSSNDYSENTTIKVTAVDPAGVICEDWTGSVNIAEDTSDPGYVEIYSQNGGDLPSSITLLDANDGVVTFVAKSLAGPAGSSSPPNAAKVKTTNYDVYNPGGPYYLSVAQWVDLGQVHSESEAGGAVYDWLETIVQDMWTTTGDLGTVLAKVDKYRYGYIAGAYGRITPGQWDHASPTDIDLNPYFVAVRLNTSRSVSCGQPSCPKSVNYTVIHEGRHCYQDWLSSVDLGQPDDAGSKPDNDDDQDWVVETVPIGPSNYILDTGTSRTTCSGNKSFSGDGTADSWSGNVQEAIEKDAFEYATAND